MRESEKADGVYGRLDDENGEKKCGTTFEGSPVKKKDSKRNLVDCKHFLKMHEKSTTLRIDSTSSSKPPLRISAGLFLHTTNV